MQNHSLPQSSQMTNFSPTEFDYTFTDKELQDILGFMEHQAGGQDAAATPAPPPFLSQPSPSGLGLQFQPHPAPVQSGSTLGPHSYDQKSTAGVKGEPASSSTGFGPGLGVSTANGVNLAGGHPGTRSNAFGPAATAATLPERRSSLQQIQSTAAPRQDRGQSSSSCSAPACTTEFLALYVRVCMQNKLDVCRTQAAH